MWTRAKKMVSENLSESGDCLYCFSAIDKTVLFLIFIADLGSAVTESSWLPHLQSHGKVPLVSVITIEPPRDKTNKMAFAPSEDSDQPGHPPSLIRVFAVRMKKAWVLIYPLSVQRRLFRLGRCPGWSESLLGAHTTLLVLSRGSSIISDYHYPNYLNICCINTRARLLNHVAELYFSS